MHADAKWNARQQRTTTHAHPNGSITVVCWDGIYYSKCIVALAVKCDGTVILNAHYSSWKLKYHIWSVKVLFRLAIMCGKFDLAETILVWMEFSSSSQQPADTINGRRLHSAQCTHIIPLYVQHGASFFVQRAYSASVPIAFVHCVAVNRWLCATMRWGKSTMFEYALYIRIENSTWNELQWYLARKYANTLFYRRIYVNNGN